MNLKVFLNLLQSAIQEHNLFPFLTSQGRIRFHTIDDRGSIFCPITAVEFFRFGHMVTPRLAGDTTTDHELKASNGIDSDVIVAADYVNPKTPSTAKLREKLLRVCKLIEKDS